MTELILGNLQSSTYYKVAQTEHMYRQSLPKRYPLYASFVSVIDSSLFYIPDITTTMPGWEAKGALYGFCAATDGTSSG